MRMLYLKDSSDRKRQFALTTRICIKNGKRVAVKAPCFPEGISHIKRIVESQSLFAKYYGNVEINKTWIENDMLYAEYVEGISLSDFYLKAIQKKDKDEIIRLLKFHVELALGRNNDCLFKSTADFTKIFGETNSFEDEPALSFTFFDPIPENIIFINGDITRPCFIDYEWFFDFPMPISILKFRIAKQLSLISGIDDIIFLNERMRNLNCVLPIEKGFYFFYKFSDFVNNGDNVNSQIINKNFKKHILQAYSLYFDTGEGYSENEKYNQSFSGNIVEISCVVPENTIAIRLDPIEGYGCIISNFEILSYNGIVDYEPINCFTNNNGDMIFINTAPEIKIHRALNWLKIKYQILILSEPSHYRILNNYITTTHERDSLLNSRSWRLTKPLRLFAKSLLSIKRNGIKETIKKIVTYKREHK